MSRYCSSPVGSSALLMALLVVMFWMPLPEGSKPVWASALLVVLMLLLGMAWAIGHVFGKLSLTLAFKKAWPLHLGFILVCFWLWIQTIPLPESLLNSLSPNAHALWQQVPLPKWTLSLDPKATELSLWLSVAYYVQFCLILLSVDSPSRIRSLLGVLVISGTFQALFGSLSTLSGLEVLLFSEKEAYFGVATGTFVNRNSFAGYLEMTLALGVGLLVSRLGEGRAYGDWRTRLQGFLSTMMSSKVLLRSALAIMVIGLVISRSRMGNTAFFSSLLITGLLYLVLRRQMSRGMVFLLVSMLLVDLAIVSQWFGIEQVVERIEQTSLAKESRPDVSAVSLDIIKDYFLTGTGGGSFYTALPNYHNGSWQGFYDLAHNDFLQFPLELGMPVFLVLVVMVLLSFWQATMAIKYRRRRLMAGLGFSIFQS